MVEHATEIILSSIVAAQSELVSLSTDISDTQPDVVPVQSWPLVVRNATFTIMDWVIESSRDERDCTDAHFDKLKFAIHQLLTKPDSFSPELAKVQLKEIIQQLFSEPVSAGSFGHPSSCQTPCRRHVFGKPGSCKWGESCTYCHFQHDAAKASTTRQKTRVAQKRRSFLEDPMSTPEPLRSLLHDVYTIPALVFQDITKRLKEMDASYQLVAMHHVLRRSKHVGEKAQVARMKLGQDKQHLFSETRKKVACTRFSETKLNEQCKWLEGVLASLMTAYYQFSNETLTFDSAREQLRIFMEEVESLHLREFNVQSLGISACVESFVLSLKQADLDSGEDPSEVESDELQLRRLLEVLLTPAPTRGSNAGDHSEEIWSEITEVLEQSECETLKDVIKQLRQEFL